jgi:hypothetical protein
MEKKKQGPVSSDPEDQKSDFESCLIIPTSATMLTAKIIQPVMAGT